MTITLFTPDHPLWPEYLAHLERATMRRWGVTEDNQPLPDTSYLGAVVAARVVAHLSLRRQPLLLPAGDAVPQETPILDADGQPLLETFVQTFAVDAGCRRQGHGRALQLAALALTRELGACQLRSWSSLGHDANYALKISLGFAACPALFVTPTGEKVSGVYFVKPV